jgi:dienelactone hydrolase
MASRPSRRLRIRVAILAVLVGAVAVAIVALRPPGAARGTDVSSAAAVTTDLPYAQPGPHQVGWRQVRVTPDSGSAFDALVYYPAASAGGDAPVDDEGAPFPAITFGHGFFQEPSRYAGMLAHLASWGFIVIATESQAGLSPDHAQFAEDLSASLTFLARSDADPSSPFHGRVRTDRFGASGHSMGGGASVLATAEDDRVRALANMAAADTRPSAVEAMADVRVPVHLIVGSEDGIVPPDSTRRMYDAARAPRLFTTIVGGSHCGFQSDPFPIGCDQGSLPAEEQQALTHHLLVAFFRLYLTDDGDWDAVWGPEADADPRLERTADPGVAPTATGAPSTAPMGTATATSATTPGTAVPSASASPPATFTGSPPATTIPATISPTVEVSPATPSGTASATPSAATATPATDPLARVFLPRGGA